MIPTLPAGGYMGEGLLPIPEKIVKKIFKLSLVDMRCSSRGRRSVALEM